MTVIFIAMIKDRHRDIDPHPFTEAESAVAYARQHAETHADGAVDEQPIAGWLYHANYSEDGDAVWVVAKELDASRAS